MYLMLNQEENKLPEQITLTQQDIQEIKKASVSDIQRGGGDNYYPWYIDKKKIYLPQSSLEKTQFTKDPDLEMNCCPIYL
jgi:hypothetical protein